MLGLGSISDIDFLLKASYGQSPWLYLIFAGGKGLVESKSQPVVGRSKWVASSGAFYEAPVVPKDRVP